MDPKDSDLEDERGSFLGGGNSVESPTMQKFSKYENIYIYMHISTYVYIYMAVHIHMHVHIHIHMILMAVVFRICVKNLTEAA